MINATTVFRFAAPLDFLPPAGKVHVLGAPIILRIYISIAGTPMLNIYWLKHLSPQLHEFLEDTDCRTHLGFTKGTLSQVIQQIEDPGGWVGRFSFQAFPFQGTDSCNFCQSHN